MFYAKQIEIAKLRKDSMTGEGWDLAYRQYLSSMVSMSNKTLKKNNELLKLAFQDDIETSTVSSSIKDNDPTINTNHSSMRETTKSNNNSIPINLNDDADDE